MTKKKVIIIDENRQKGRADSLLKYVQSVADKYKFDVDVTSVHHKEINQHLREKGVLAKEHQARGYLPSGGEGNYTPKGEPHTPKSKDEKGKSFKPQPHMRRSNKLYDHLVKLAKEEDQGIYVHGVCEGFQAVAQAVSEAENSDDPIHPVNSGKLYSNKEEGRRNKYHIVEKDAAKLGKNVTISENEHQGSKYVTAFEKDNISGTQHHPEVRQSPEDEATIKSFLEKVTGKISSLEKRVANAPQPPKKKVNMPGEYTENYKK